MVVGWEGHTKKNKRSSNSNRPWSLEAAWFLLYFLTHYVGGVCDMKNYKIFLLYFLSFCGHCNNYDHHYYFKLLHVLS